LHELEDEFEENCTVSGENANEYGEKEIPDVRSFQFLKERFTSICGHSISSVRVIRRC